MSRALADNDTQFLHLAAAHNANENLLADAVAS
jgi:hypothetical protein